MVWLLLIPGAIVLFLIVLVARAAMFKPRALPPRPEPAPVDIDGERAVRNLQEMVKLETVWNWDDDPDGKPFEAFRELLARLYPLVHKRCGSERIGRGGLLLHWKGKSVDHPTVFMAHYDVVPAEAENWQKPPFSAVREGDVIWGRGTLDTKSTLCASLEAAEALMGKGYVPANDVYFSYAGDEETDSTDAPAIVDALKSRGISPALVLDEGGAVVEKVFPGVSRPTALIGTAEKGSANVSFSVSGMGGHASAPPTRTPIGILARAVVNVEGNAMAAHLCEPVLRMFDTLGRHSTFAYKLIFSNLWCFKGLFTAICKKSGGELNALVRTTCAFTQMQGSSARNVLPPSANITGNIRLMSPDTMDSIIADLEKRVNDSTVSITRLTGVNPSPFSNMDSEGYGRLCNAIAATWPDALISPYLMIACSDSRHFCRISDVVLRFSAMALSGDDRKRIHGNDERIREDQFIEALAFYRRMMLSS